MKTLQHHCGQITAHRSHITEARTTRMHLMKTVQHHCGRIRARPRTGRVGVGGEGCLSLLLYTTLLTTGVLLYTLYWGCYFIPYCVCCFILCFLQRGCYFIIRFLLGGALYFLRHFILYFFTANIGVSGYLCATLHSASYKGCHFILYFLIWLSTS